MRRKSWIFVVAPLLIGLYVGSAVADTSPHMEKGKPTLRALLARAKEVVAAGENGRAAYLLREARRLLGEMRRAIEAGDRQKVRRIELRVRELIHRAIEVAGAPERAPKALEKLNGLLSRADEIVRGSGKADAEELLTKAHAFYEEASAAIEGGEHLKGLRLIRKAEELVRRSIFIVKGEEEAKEAVGKLEDLIAHAKEVTSESQDDRVGQLLGEAEELEAKASEALGAEEYGKALRIAHRVSELVRRAVLIAKAPEKAPKALKGLNQLLTRADEVVKGSDKIRASIALRRAHRSAKEASDAIEAGRYLQGLESIRKGMELAEQAIFIADGPGEVLRISEKLKELLTHANEIVSRSGNEEAGKLLHKALDLERIGSEAAERGDFRGAFHIMRRAVGLASKAIAIVENEAEEREQGKLAAGIEPNRFSLSQNYPNPFNTETTIIYSIPEAGEVTLKVYNALGQEVRTLAQGVQQQGRHSVRWDGRDESGVDVATGIYFYRMDAWEKFGQTRRMLLAR